MKKMKKVFKKEIIGSIVVAGVMLYAIVSIFKPTLDKTAATAQKAIYKI